MAEEEDEYGSWSAAQAEDLRREAVRLASGIVEHATAMGDFAGGRPSEAQWDAPSEALRGLLQSYGEALFRYTGSYDPITNVYPPEDSEYEPEDGTSDDSMSRISILQRTDYAIVSEAELLQAGISAEMSSANRDSLEEVRSRISSAIPDALYSIAHASSSGWSALSDSPGIVPIISITVVTKDCAPTDANDIDFAFNVSDCRTLFPQVDQF